MKKESIPFFDLQLSGHTHNGQIFPLNFLTRSLFGSTTGKLYDLGSANFYITSGAGMWGPPIRFLAKPEVVIIHLLPLK